MRFELRDLELVLAVAEHGSITAAAQAVGLSLSTASARLTALEVAEETLLFERGRGGARATEAGTDVVRRARRVLGEAEALEDALNAGRRGAQRRVRLASNTSAVDGLTEFLAASLARFASLRVELREESSADVATLVRDGAADLGVVSVPEAADVPSHRVPGGDGVIASELWADPLVVLGLPAELLIDGRGLSAAPGDPAGTDNPREVSFSQVLAAPLVGLPPGSPLQRLIDARAAEAGVEPTYRVRLPTLAAVFAVASTGAGAAIIPAGTARRLGARDEDVCALREGWARRRAYLLAPAERELSRAQREFAEAMLRFRDEEG